MKNNIINNIPLSVPSINGNEWKYIKECLDTEWVSTAGKFVDEFERKISNYTGAKYAIACINGTSAIQVSLKIAGLLPGDEVIVPSLTFIAPVNAIAYNGGNPIFMDSDKYYNIDAEKTIEFIVNETFFKNGFSYNKKTKNKISAIIPVHVWGNAVWLDELITLCIERNISLIEDASESLGSFYNKGSFSGKHTGTIGDLGCLSFNVNKIVTDGGCGMILTDNENFDRKSRYLTTQAKDDPVRYVHDEIGYNFRLSNIQAALGVAQLEQLKGFLKCKRKIHQYYSNAMKTIKGLTLLECPDYAINNHWLNVIKINSKNYGEDSEFLMKRLEKKGIHTRPVWTLNHLQKPYDKFQKYKIERSIGLVEKSLCLPSSVNLDFSNIEIIIQYLSRMTTI